ncbi:DUF2690 domain-containing protein [Streptomyces antnestii]|uniref:DUF2690 domain-containing protein n=1 Tax=Streptomyces antnestii TaxID=2494256 RepID=A0A437P7S3_9ACTN|nr:XRE family transcriptional regulator [Streptomyces sp. San01]RVU18311.1 DUF2690 domain-containing protein [Streptomyces sp. San01]
MPRWRELPDELDPEVREFASRLRRLVDRGGLSIAAVADRTGYSKTSWERYLNGRLLAPKRAIVALAEVTGTDPVHLTTMWELAERAWSRSEMRHDMTMEAIRISQARAAPGEFGPKATKNGTSEAAGVAGPESVAGGAPTAPAQGQTPRADSPPDRQRRGRRLTMFLAGVVGALVAIAGAVYLTGGGMTGKDDGAKPRATPTTSAPELPVGVECAGKDCSGKDPEKMGCGGEFARTADSVLVGAARIEVRYSKTCGAAWARITQASPGDTVQIRQTGGSGSNDSSGGTGVQKGTVDADFDAYTPMVAVMKASEAKACATLKTGRTGCTK